MDSRMACTCCGELGRMVKSDYAGSVGFFIACDREGLQCCQTHDCPTEEGALRAWEVFHDDDESEGGDAIRQGA